MIGSRLDARGAVYVIQTALTQPEAGIRASRTSLKRASGRKDALLAAVPWTITSETRPHALRLSCRTAVLPQNDPPCPSRWWFCYPSLALTQRVLPLQPRRWLGRGKPPGKASITLLSIPHVGCSTPKGRGRKKTGELHSGLGRPIVKHPDELISSCFFGLVGCPSAHTEVTTEKHARVAKKLCCTSPGQTTAQIHPERQKARRFPAGGAKTVRVASALTRSMVTTSSRCRRRFPRSLSSFMATVLPSCSTRVTLRTRPSPTNLGLLSSIACASKEAFSERRRFPNGAVEAVTQ